MPNITLTKDEAEILYNHLETSILEEVRNVAEDYDNMHYLVTLCNIYQRCKAVAEKIEKSRKINSEIERAFDVYNVDGAVKLSDLATFTGMTEKTLRYRLRDHGGFIIAKDLVMRTTAAGEHESGDEDV